MIEAQIEQFKLAVTAAKEIGGVVEVRSASHGVELFTRVGEQTVVSGNSVVVNADEPPAAPEKKTRKSRAAKKTEEPKTEAKKEPEATGPTPTGPAATGPATTTDSKSSAPAATGPISTAAGPAGPTGPTTTAGGDAFQALRDEVGEISKQLGPRVPEVGAMLIKDFGVSKISGLDPSKYDEFLEKCRGLLT